MTDHDEHEGNGEEQGSGRPSSGADFEFTPPPEAPDSPLSPPASPGSRKAAAEGDAGGEAEGGADEPGRSWSPSQMELGEDFVQEPIAPRVYYSIGEVCDLTGLKPHVLRYWESQFEVMNPTKNRAGNRVYRPKDIDLIFLVKRLLYEEKYTIEGARQRLLEMRQDGALDDEKQEVLGPEFLAEMKRELLTLQNLLTLPAAEE